MGGGSYNAVDTIDVTVRRRAGWQQDSAEDTSAKDMETPEPECGYTAVPLQ
jgi:hypothetical protein